MYSTISQLTLSGMRLSLYDISINGDASLETSTIDNFSTKEYVPSDIIFCQPIDVPPCSLLQHATKMVEILFNLD
jgi:hypothetical protein